VLSFSNWFPNILFLSNADHNENVNFPSIETTSSIAEQREEHRNNLIASYIAEKAAKAKAKYDLITREHAIDRLAALPPAETNELGCIMTTNKPVSPFI